MEVWNMMSKNLFSVVSLALFVFIGNTAFAACPSADLTGDCLVDLLDFAVMANQWLTTEPNAPENLNMMVFVPGGGFEMGRHVGDGGSDELPPHPVLLDAFFMSKFKITNQQYCDYLNSALGSGSIYVFHKRVVGTGNDQDYCDTSESSSCSQIVYSGGVFIVRTKPEVDGRDMSDDPMVQVTWYGAVAYCNWRSSEEGYDSCYNLSTWDCDFSKYGYRLATEAEWEYAARGGEHNPYYRFPWGDTISHSQAHYRSYWADGSPVYPYDVNPTEGYHPDWDDGIAPITAPVGSFPPNGYGLYDMAGNLWEWCNDRYDSDYYNVSSYDNPKGPASGSSHRVLRGGDGSANACRVANRLVYLPGVRSNNAGFRIVLDLN